MGSAIGPLAGMATGALAANASSAGTAPSADEAGEVKNADATYGTATGDAAQTQAAATALNTQSQGTLANSLGSETPMVNNVNNTANTNMSTYGSTFTPLQSQQAKTAAAYAGDQNTQQLGGQAVADSNSATQASLANQRASLASEGVDPASVHGDALTSQANIQGAANAAGAKTNSYLNTQATGNSLVNTANQLGLQVGAAGTAGATAGSGISTANVGNENSTDNSNVNNLTASSTDLNAATGANNAGITANNDQFNQQQTSYQDAQQAAASKGSGLSSMISAAAPLAMMAMERGGVVPSGIPHMRGGGPISHVGASPLPLVPGTTDTKLIAATPGEFMIPKDVTQHLGHEKLHKLIDKTREEIAVRKGIPTAQLSSAHTSMGA